MRHRILVAFSIVYTALSASALGQRGTTVPPDVRATAPAPMTIVSGSLTGTVRDQSRAVVPKIDVTVTLETSANVEPYRTTTDQEGRFRFTGLPLGTYCLAIRDTRSGLTVRPGIRVRGAQDTDVPVVLGEPSAGAPATRPRSCDRKESR